MSKSKFSIALTAVSNGVAQVSDALSKVADKFIVTVTNHMPRHISLPEIGIFLKDVNTNDGSNTGSGVVTSKDALLRCISSIESIAQLNRYDSDCVTLEFEIEDGDQSDSDKVVNEEQSTDQVTEGDGNTSAEVITANSEEVAQAAPTGAVEEAVGDTATAENVVAATPEVSAQDAPDAVESTVAETPDEVAVDPVADVTATATATQNRKNKK